MTAPDRPVIVWFGRDLRLSDHPALTAAVATSQPILAVYVLDESGTRTRPPGGASRWWLDKSLQHLAESLARLGALLVLRRGDPVEVLAALVRETAATTVFASRDHRPDGASLQQAVSERLAGSGVKLRRFAGAVLFEPEAVATGSGGPFRVFTPFWRACLSRAAPPEPLPAPRALVPYHGPVESERLRDWGLHPSRPDWSAGLASAWHVGEAAAQDALTRFLSQGVAAYAEGRDRPDHVGTSRLSPHLAFGEISARQCWHAARHAADADPRLERGASSFLRELGWREFSAHLLHHFPHLPSAPFKPDFATFPWRQDDAALARWQRGATGYPLIDAGLRELWQTGWMHNRVRMVVASFLVKHLLIPWQAGEAWFWDTLVDADLANNVCGWQWVAGCGADAAPYFRIFNPIMQGRKFDPDGAYVRRWLPELARLPTDVLHAPWEASAATRADAGLAPGSGTYPEPIVAHAAARERALAALRQKNDTSGEFSQSG
ncbi:MAG: deoxyribodipyrimidine photo-lyase [Hyphomicrobiaceae bacterium]